MQKVRDIMTLDPITVTPDSGISEAARILLDKHINGVPVMDADERLVGILCQSDLISQQKEIPLPSFFTLLDGIIPLCTEKHLESQVQKIAAATVDAAMTRKVVAVSPGTSIQKVASLMVDHNFHTLPVIEDGRLVGIVGKEDVLRTLIE